MNNPTIDQILLNLDTLDCPSETKKRVMQGAITCVRRWGMEKTSLNDIAREAGCTRQTVYNYFKNRDAVILAALMDSAAEFSKKLIEHIETFETIEDKIVEAMMFTLKHLPEEPYLQLLSDPKLSPIFNQHVFYSNLCLGTLTQIAEHCVKDFPDLVEHSSEIGEVMTRFFLSLLLIKSPRNENDEEMRAFLRRWILPGVVAARE